MHPVLCWYKAKPIGYYSHITGTVMIHVHRAADIMDEFKLQMALELKRYHPTRFASIDLVKYLPKCGSPNF